MQKPEKSKSLARLRLVLSHLCEHTFKHSFEDSVNPIWSCDKDIETSVYFLLQCPHYLNERSFVNVIRNIDGNILRKKNLQVNKTFCHGNTFSKNITLLFSIKINFQITTKSFNMLLFQTEYGFLYWQHLLKICHLFFYITFFSFSGIWNRYWRLDFYVSRCKCSIQKKRKNVKQIDFIQKIIPQKKYSTY